MPAQIDKETGEELPESNTILNLILIAVGAIFVIQGIIMILGWAGIAAPEWLQTIGGSAGGEAALALFGQNTLVTLILGVWCFIAGIGLFQEQEWAWGQALVVLSIIITNGVGSLIGWIQGGTFDISNALTWVTLISFILSIIAFFYLLFTKKRYA
ncbi:MAG: hypothetical protein ACTSRZ_17325 [Promethearchaeota archaeon]